MKDLAGFLWLKLTATHNMHNLTCGATFLQDHEFFGSIYSQATEHYDSVVERVIGLGQEIGLNELQQKASRNLPSQDYSNPSENLKYLKTLNKTILAKIEYICEQKGTTEGVKQLIGNIADMIEVESYKIGQRCK